MSFFRRLAKHLPVRVKKTLTVWEATTVPTVRRHSNNTLIPPNLKATIDAKRQGLSNPSRRTTGGARSIYSTVSPLKNPGSPTTGTPTRCRQPQNLNTCCSFIHSFTHSIEKTNPTFISRSSCAFSLTDRKNGGEVIENRGFKNWDWGSLASEYAAHAVTSLAEWGIRNFLIGYQRKFWRGDLCFDRWEKKTTRKKNATRHLKRSKPGLAKSQQCCIPYVVRCNTKHE